MSQPFSVAVAVSTAFALVILATAFGHAPARAQNPLDSIVSIDAEIRHDARTRDRLGLRRQGSGVVLDEDGLILTIGYIVMEASAVEVETRDGATVPAEVIAYHAESGFGLLRTLVPVDVPSIEIGESASVERGDRVLLAAFGGRDAVKPGAVVARRTYAGEWEYLLPDAIFTIPLHPNVPGAALIDGNGTLVGIGYLTLSQPVVARGIVPGNMFVPVDVLKPILDDLLDDGFVEGPRPPWLGLHAREVRDRVFVERVAAGGPADRAGIRPGDIVVEVGTEPVRSLEAFWRKLWEGRRAGDVVPLSVLGESEIETLDVHSIDRYEWFRLHETTF